MEHFLEEIKRVEEELQILWLAAKNEIEILEASDPENIQHEKHEELFSKYVFLAHYKNRCAGAFQALRDYAAFRRGEQNDT